MQKAMEKLEQERTVLEQKNIALESEVAEKDELIYVLSEAVNQKTQMENNYSMTKIAIQEFLMILSQAIVPLL